eukprot:TRINITY_DN25502_c0_g1_i2.p1 TRINITY_DN25502_c0_g1~~TRINITY_DN25502_c0_g1_i2.p1  ORF type:complete len:371 (+),score=93.14 TRINITY_DN25502_c0_g1_i2:52-1164(+)
MQRLGGGGFLSRIHGRFRADVLRARDVPRCVRRTLHSLASSTQQRRWRTERPLKPEQEEYRRALPIIAAFYVVVSIFGAGFFYVFIWDNLYTAICIYTAPFDVLGAAADIAAQHKKYGCAPLFLRLSWQASCLYDPESNTGANTGSLADPDSPFNNHPSNKGLDRAIALLRPIKAAYPEASWADLIALAGCVGVEELGGPRVGFCYGRKDAPLDISEEEAAARAPNHTLGLRHVKSLFYRLGFSRGELVALMGAHTVGATHRHFTGVNGKRGTTPFLFNNSYFVELMDGDWKASEGKPGEPTVMRHEDLTYFHTDVAMKEDPAMMQYIQRFATDEILFHTVFAKAFQKLLNQGHPRLYDSAWRGVSESRL